MTLTGFVAAVAVLDRVVDALGHPGEGPLAELVEHLHRHDRAAEGEAGHADGVVRGLGDGRGHVRAVVLVVVGVVVAVDEVVAGQERRVAPVRRLAEDLARARVGVVLVGDAAVEHRHRHGGLSLLDPPGPLGVHLGEVPLEGVEAVVGLEGGGLGAAHDAVRLGVGDLGHPREPLDRLGDAEAGLEGHEVVAGRAGAPGLARPARAEHPLDVAGLRAGTEGHDHLALAVGRAGGAPRTVRTARTTSSCADRRAGPAPRREKTAVATAEFLIRRG